MKVWVNVGGDRLTALLDSGSTHNFMDADVAKRLGLPLQSRAGLRVAVANGDRVPWPGVLKDVTVAIGGEQFVIDCYALPLGGYDMVLGVHWLSSLGPILWDFARQTMGFVRQGRRVLWSGLDAPMLQAVHTLRLDETDLMGALLEDFTDLFQEPRGLPPARSHSHRIRLLPGTGAVAVRRYRYAHTQKDELERQCDKLLRQGVIRPSSSAFSSPALLVRKLDGSWL